ncbi:MAG: xanthine dehydrogenase family protein molybdopterin-binding subunit, partial [Acidobacteria bacterium]|nr:xanthine dehydrogenase family protein molybdopterin-binding subunit [Acidobacteriota bacterium]
MADYNWPAADKRSLIGKRISRLDGPAKVSGKAKYTYDIKRPGMLYGKILRSPYAHARIVSIDAGAAEKMPGVRAVKVIQGPGTEIHWAGDEIVAVAAIDEPTAEDAVRAIKVQYEKLPHYVVDTDPGGAGNRAKPTAAQVQGDPDAAFNEADVISKGVYGCPVITHCPLEAHGSISEWNGEELLVHMSTQNVSGIAGQMGEPLEIPAGNIRVMQDHIGGGFGSKFGPDRWGIETARLSKLAGGKPVKIMLERDAEMMVAGCRPSAYARVRVAAKKDGTLMAWQSDSWGTGGKGGGAQPPIPYIFNIPHQRKQHTALDNNIGSARAWRAPNHPQACLITMSALDDLAARLDMDPLELLLKNIELAGPRADVYRQELQKAAEMIEWKKNWHPRGDRSAGPFKRGLGVSLHTWGGRAHNSNCDLTIQPDGSVEVKLGSQDLGTGTRTCIAIVAAETFGLPVDAVKVMIGDNRFPVSGGSGGSTTIGGVSSSTRRAAQDALEQLFSKIAPALNAQPGDLEAAAGKIQVKSDPARAMTWKQACARLGGMPLAVRGQNPGPGDLNSSGVGGVQMADVSVDVETGIVKVNKLVAVQDCGLIIDLKLAESQCYGAMIMGTSYALYEEKV